MSPADFAARLDAKACSSGWEARCPAHKDHRASLSIGTGDKGDVVIFCHAGCTKDAVLTAMHLRDRDLFSSQQPTTKQIAATYDYTDEDGTVLYQVLRYEPKDFRQRRPNGSGGWTWRLGNVRRVLYGLPDVRVKLQDLACVEYRRQHGLTDDVFVVEGEKDVERLWQRGLIATTNSGGAGKWRDDYAQQLVTVGAKRIVILPDNDAAGHKHADDVSRSCQVAGLTVKVVELPDLPAKGDVSDWLRDHHHHTIADLVALAQGEPVTNEVTHSETIDLPTLLSDVEQFIRQHVVMTPEASILLALWVAQTYVLAAFDFVAYLHIHSPLPECGKSRLLEILEALVLRPWYTGRVTAAVLMRKVDAEHPVLLLDESDAAFNGDKEYSEALRGQLNTGFCRTGKASVCVRQGANITYKDFSTFGPKAIAGLGTLDRTIVSRSIPIELKRRAKSEPITKWRWRDGWARAAPIRQQLATLATYEDTLRAAEPTMPDGLGDRAEDVLEPLFAIADLAGGDWPACARKAAVRLMGLAARTAQETNQNIGQELLTDIRAVFADHDNPSELSTKTIIDSLSAMDERPWGSWGTTGKRITPHKVSRMLKAFDVHAGKLWIDGKEVRGYRLAAFLDPFERYIPLDLGSEVSKRRNANNDGPELAKNEVSVDPPTDTLKTAVSPDKHWLLDTSTLQTPDSGGESVQTTETDLDFDPDDDSDEHY